MTKIPLIKMYKDDEVPDHLLQEVQDLVTEMIKVLHKPCNGKDANVLLSAFNRMHAILIIDLVTERSLSEAAGAFAVGLIKNVESLSGKKILEDNEGMN